MKIVIVVYRSSNKYWILEKMERERERLSEEEDI